MKIDGIISKNFLRQIARRRILILKRKILSPPPKLEKNFLTKGKRILFRLGLILPKEWKKTLVVFLVGIFTIFSLLEVVKLINSGQRLGKRILGMTTSSISQFQSGDFAGSTKNLQLLKEELRDSNKLLLKILNSFSFGPRLEELLAAGERVLVAFDLASRGWRELAELRLVWDPLTNSSSQEFYTSLKSARSNFLESRNNIENLLTILSGFKVWLLPAEQQNNFREVLGQLQSAKSLLQDSIAVQDFILNLLGGEKKTYLLIFQNNNEARPTGGFIGTYGILEFENGLARISKIESVYALDGQLRELILAPSPLRRQVTTYWGLRDSNWFVDFPKSSQKMLSFLEKGTGIFASGVISFTPNVFEKLLAITGPVEMPAYGVTLTSENFRSTVQYKTSIDYDRDLNQPKKFLADFTPRILEKLGSLSSRGWLDFINLLSQMITEKHVLLFSQDEATRQQIVSFGAGGTVRETEGDYLAIFHSNVGGGKTDQKIYHTVSKKISLDSGGLAIARLKITRHHQGFDEQYFPKNLDYLRILVPKGAKLLSASGFDDPGVFAEASPAGARDQDIEIWEKSFIHDPSRGMFVGEESGYQVFSNWLTLEPGQTKTVELIYEVQFDSRKPYTHLLQSQAGAVPYEFNFELTNLAGKVNFAYPKGFEVSGNKAHFSEVVRTDRFYGVVGE